MFVLKQVHGHWHFTSGGILLHMSTQHILEELMPVDSFSPLGTIFSDSEWFLFWLMFHLWEGLAISSCSKPTPGVRSRIRWSSLVHCCDHGHLNCQQPQEGKKALAFNHKCNRNGVKPDIVNFLRCSGASLSWLGVEGKVKKWSPIRIKPVEGSSSQARNLWTQNSPIGDFCS